MKQDLRDQFRCFLKDSIRLQFDFSQTDQSKGVPPPPIEKPFAPDITRIDLIKQKDLKSFRSTSLVSAIEERKSHRHFTGSPLTLEEISFLLWATQGIRKKIDSGTAYRTVPSAGCRHAIETYLCVLNVTGVERGIYRYLPLEHQLLLESRDDNLAEKAVEAALGQPFIGKSAVTFIWTAIPYRMEWRYGLAAHKVIALDAGHICQNLYLAVSAVGAGTCAVAAYHQQLMDELLRIDGKDEFTIYLAPVGKI
ncbi:MAG: SagB/ThcOx family dehydrogenase [Nitrospiraceae bacterium]|nr:MAG: SagB/ThcOx family dehydrogenase [Nitrospiraceae bacterium]